MRAALLAAFLLAAGPAHADEAHDLAADIVSLTGGDQTLDKVITLVRDKVVAAIAARNGKTAAEIGADFDLLVRPALQQILPQLRVRLADLYARTYDVADLRGLDTFYRSTVGQHLLARAPQIAIAITTEIFPVLQAEVLAAVQAAAARFKQRGIEL